MPGGDRTGPMGMGPMTGRGMGYCAGFAVPGYAGPPGGGYGRGWGRGRSRGWRNMYYATGEPPAATAPATMTQQQELELLKQQAEQTAQTLEEIRQRISRLEGESST